MKAGVAALTIRNEEQFGASFLKLVVFNHQVVQTVAGMEYQNRLVRVGAAALTAYNEGGLIAFIQGLKLPDRVSILQQMNIFH